MNKYIIIALATSVVSYMAMGVCVIIKDVAETSESTGEKLMNTSFIFGSISILSFVAAAAMVILSKSI